MYSNVFYMYPRARIGKPSDTIKIQHARCEYKRILAHEGGMASRQDTSKIQAKYKQDTLATGAYNLYPACIRPVSHACAVHLRARLADSSGTSGGTTCFFLGPFLTGFLPSSAGSGHV